MIVSKVTHLKDDLFDCENIIIKTSNYPVRDGDIVVFKGKKLEIPIGDPRKGKALPEFPISEGKESCNDSEKIIYDYDNNINPLLDPYFTVSFQNKQDLKDFLKRNYKTQDNEDISKIYEFFTDYKTPVKEGIPSRNILTKINSTFAYLLEYSGKNFYNFLVENKYFFNNKKVKEIFQRSKSSPSFTKLVTSFYKSMCSEIYLRCFYLLGLKNNHLKSYLYETYDNIFTEKKKLIEKEEKATESVTTSQELNWNLSMYDKTQSFIEDIFLFIKKNPYLFIYDDLLSEKIISSYYPPDQFLTVKNDLKIFSLLYRKVFRSNQFYVTVEDKDPEQEKKIIEFLKGKKEILKEVYRMVFLPKTSRQLENRLYIHKRLQVETFIKEFVKKNSDKITIITGGPGTGKTTRIATLEKEAESTSGSIPEILFLSYTGKAVCKIKEKVTRKDKCKTIHYALEKYGKDKISHDIIIVDETSMVSGELFYKMFIQKPVKFTFKKLFLIGDPNQLPPIDWGNVFELAIKTIPDRIEVLTVNYRQNEYLKNVVTTFRETGTLNGLGDEYILNYSSRDKLKQILSVLKDKKNILFISPVNSMCDYVNNEIFGKGFSKGEKVILNENKYISDVGRNGDGVSGKEGEGEAGENLIPNGAIGEIVKNEQVQMIDDYGNKHLFPLDKTMFSLCYCLTVHKMQGSECDDLVLILPSSCTDFVDKKLFYTAISRPKNKLIILTDIVDIKKKIVFK